MDYRDIPLSELDIEFRDRTYRSMSFEDRALFVALGNRDYIVCSLADSARYCRLDLTLSIGCPLLTRKGKLVRDLCIEEANKPRGPSLLDGERSPRELEDDRMRTETKTRRDAATDIEPYYYVEERRWGPDITRYVTQRNDTIHTPKPSCSSVAEAKTLVDLLNRAHRSGYSTAAQYIKSFATSLQDGK